MRKIYPLFILSLFLLAQGSFAQTYYKLLKEDTTVWQHFNCFIPVSPNGKSAASIYLNSTGYASLDTISTNGLTYRKTYNLNTGGILYNFKSLVGYMREDTVAKKIYFKETLIQPEALLYDFSLNVGDSVQYSFPNNNTQDGYYRADSIIVKNTRGGPRKHFYMRKHVNNPMPQALYYVFIEGIGSTYHALYRYGSLDPYNCQLQSTPQCSHIWSMGLACKYNDRLKQYQSCTFVLAQANACLNALDSCTYGNICGGLRSYTRAEDLKIFPNPANDQLTIKFEGTMYSEVDVKVFNVLGEEMRGIIPTINAASKEILLKTASLKNGMYFIELKNGSYLYREGIMISH
jgi:hypothetical protein